jgi:hypothetical protein
MGYHLNNETKARICRKLNEQTLMPLTFHVNLNHFDRGSVTFHVYINEERIGQISGNFHNENANWVYNPRHDGCYAQNIGGFDPTSDGLVPKLLDRVEVFVKQNLNNIGKIKQGKLISEMVKRDLAKLTEGKRFDRMFTTNKSIDFASVEVRRSAKSDIVLNARNRGRERELNYESRSAVVLKEDLHKLQPIVDKILGMDGELDQIFKEGVK